jgi:hypothetical protein
VAEYKAVEAIEDTAPCGKKREPRYRLSAGVNPSPLQYRHRVIKDNACRPDNVDGRVLVSGVDKLDLTHRVPQLQQFDVLRAERAFAVVDDCQGRAVGHRYLLYAMRRGRSSSGEVGRKPQDCRSFFEIQKQG